LVKQLEQGRVFFELESWKFPESHHMDSTRGHTISGDVCLACKPKRQVPMKY